MEIGTVLFETPTYVVVLGNIYMEDRDDFCLGYIGMNKATGVHEFERTSLPEAILVCKQATSFLNGVETYQVVPAVSDSSGQMTLLNESPLKN